MDRQRLRRLPHVQGGEQRRADRPGPRPLAPGPRPRLRDARDRAPERRAGAELRRRDHARRLRASGSRPTTSTGWSTSRRGGNRLRRVIDHVGIRVSDREASERFYTTVLRRDRQGADPLRRRVHRVGRLGCIADGRPVTQNLHIAFWVPTTELVHAFHAAGRRGGIRRATARPAPRPQYAPTTTAASCATPTATASRRSPTRSSDREPGEIDHLWLRTRDVAGDQGLLRDDRRLRRRRSSRDDDARPRAVQDRPTRRSPSSPASALTENVHIAFARTTNEQVDAFHEAAMDGGLHGQRRARRARRLPPRVLRGLRPRSRRPQHRGRQPQPLGGASVRGEAPRAPPRSSGPTPARTPRAPARARRSGSSRTSRPCPAAPAWSRARARARSPGAAPGGTRRACARRRSRARRSSARSDAGRRSARRTRRPRPSLERQRHQLPRGMREHVAQERLGQRERVQVTSARLHGQIELVQAVELGIAHFASAAPGTRPSRRRRTAAPTCAGAPAP